jgi:hypothetical protein
MLVSGGVKASHMLLLCNFLVAKSSHFVRPLALSKTNIFDDEQGGTFGMNIASNLL